MAGLHHLARRPRGAVGAVVLAIAMAVSVPAARPADADPCDFDTTLTVQGHTSGRAEGDGSCLLEGETPLDSGDDGEGSDGDNGGGTNTSSEPPPCTWLPVRESTTARERAEEVHGEIPEESALYLDGCRLEEVTGDLRTMNPDAWTDRFSRLDEDNFLVWEVPEGTEEGAPVEQVLLTELEVEVRERLEGPEPVLHPPEGAPTLVRVPVFVSVDDEEDEDPLAEVSAEECAPEPADEVCVSIEATPTLYFDPGDGTDPIECAGTGTPFEDDGTDPAAQIEAAGENPCVHAYEQPSADGFEGWVEIHWEVSWSATGLDGTEFGDEFDPVVLPDRDADDAEPNAVRVVEEVDTVVSGTGWGGGSG